MMIMVYWDMMFCATTVLAMILTIAALDILLQEAVRPTGYKGMRQIMPLLWAIVMSLVLYLFYRGRY